MREEPGGAESPGRGSRAAPGLLTSPLLFAFWLIKGQLLAALPAPRASANIWEGARRLCKHGISVRSRGRAGCPFHVAVPGWAFRARRL